MYEYKAKIIDVYDGDTVTASVELGFFVNVELKLRLFGINTPELRGSEKESGLLSKKRLEELILNKEVVIKTQKDKQEKYGRWLAEIFISDNKNTSVNQMLINEGYAKKYLP